MSDAELYRARINSRRGYADVTEMFADLCDGPVTSTQTGPVTQENAAKLWKRTGRVLSDFHDATTKGLWGGHQEQGVWARFVGALNAMALNGSAQDALPELLQFGLGLSAMRAVRGENTIFDFPRLALCVGSLVKEVGLTGVYKYLRGGDEDTAQDDLVKKATLVAEANPALGEIFQKALLASDNDWAQYTTGLVSDSSLWYVAGGKKNIAALANGIREWATSPVIRQRLESVARARAAAKAALVTETGATTNPTEVTPREPASGDIPSWDAVASPEVGTTDLTNASTATK